MPGPTTYFDPAAIDELDAATQALVERRARALGSAYRLFYEHPVRFVRGSGTRLYTEDGTEYLDAYNNVPSVGHAHPRVARAIAEQAAKLTTHTRYLDESIVDYAEDLLGTLPSTIGNIMFTCTGSEANDLALRIAKFATGGTGVIVTENAYHGVTTEIAAISPSLGGLASVADWVRVVPVGAAASAAAPAPASGPDDPAGSAAPSAFAAAVSAALADFAAAGIRPAALIVDTIFASDGVLPDVAGLADAVAAVRAAGGLFIADEVQPGFGRLGTGMWGFDRYGLEPDLVTVGKPMGNGHPVAAVMARPALVDEFNRHSRYFNTFGGNNVSIAAAQATLDVLREEQLIDNARIVGNYLLEQLGSLSDRFVDVRGSGLFIGVELETEAETVAVVNALRDRHVLLSASGKANTVLKIRPPLVFGQHDADLLLTELDTVLR